MQQGGDADISRGLGTSVAGAQSGLLPMHTRTCCTAAPKRARTGRPVGAARPAVEVDQPGCSYNPDAVQHQDAVASAVAAEVQKQLAAELAPKPPAAIAEAMTAHQQDELRLLQVRRRS